MTALSEPINVTNPKMKFQRQRKRRLFVIGGAVLGLGALTFLAAGTGLKSKIFDALGIDFRPPKPLKISLASPEPLAFNVAIDQPIVITIRKTDQTIDPSTINTQSVMLVQTGIQSQIDIDVSFQPASANTITITPKEKLLERTNYNVLLNSAIRSKEKGALEAYITSFTTEGTTDPELVFEKIALPTTADTSFTCLKIAPDRKLWASSVDGRFFIFDINEDGTLGQPTILDSIHKANGGPRLITGFDFDPASTPANPIIWASNCVLQFENAPDFSSKITRLEGKELEQVDDVIVELPRSVGDHATNQPSFGPDGALYIPQASNSAFGDPDETWGMREEHRLSATILRLDTNRVKLGDPIDVRTRDANGSYDPNGLGAPLTIYADGFRLAYDMLWHSNGS
ncbi:MAG TPA: Ig-like domain-containing protein, partial [Tepidisphaeraceae bacterium]|nr:Ig-like domain-containing protein [Tepidisphaeraceae bacterium]